MKVGIGLGLTSYLPEAFAYKTYLQSNGWYVELGNEYELSKNLDIYIYFLGIKSVFTQTKNKDIIEVHDYATLSTPPFAKTKNILKRFINIQPSGYIFLNRYVREGLAFPQKIPYIYRDMGVDSGLFQRASKNPEFDIIYCGSVSNRKGLLPTIKFLSDLGLSILVVGQLDKESSDLFKSLSNVTAVGKVERHELPKLYNNARVGLNFTPNCYPFNLQTSTKTLEYCASGLGILSTRYDWVMNFEKSRDARFLYLDQIYNRETFDNFQFKTPNVTDLEWNYLLETIGFKQFLNNLAR